MNSASARRWYVSGLFVLLMSNAIRALAGVFGVRGIAFYHVQVALLAICGVQLAALLLAGTVRRTIDPLLFGALVTSMLYTVASGLLLLRFSDVVPAYVLLMLHTLLFYPATATLMLACEQDTRKSEISPGLPRWLPWAASVVFLFGWVQYVARDPLLQVTNSENVSKLVEANLLGTFRPPSVFESSFQFGMFSVLVFCLSAAYAIFGRKSVGAWSLCLLSFSGIAISQTRNVILCGACTSLTLFLLVWARRCKTNFRFISLTPIFYVLVSVSVMVFAVVQFVGSDLAKSGDLADASSTWARVSSWQAAWENLVLRGTVFDVLFGYGITQPGHASDYLSLYPARGEGLFIDSTFVNLFLFQGLFGLLLFLFIAFLIWRRLLRETRETWEPLTVGITVFFSAFLGTGIFNILNGQWWGVTLALSLFVLSRKKKAQPSRLACAA